MAGLVGREIGAHFQAVVNWAPGGLGIRLRRLYYGRRLAMLGSRAVLGEGLLVFGGHNIRVGTDFTCWRFCTLAAYDNGVIEIGDRVSLNANVYINACIGGCIIVGNDVLIGPNVVMRTSDHVTAALDKPIREQGHVKGHITLEDDVWLGANVTLVGGTLIGRGAVVAAGAVVTRDVQPYTIVGGVPAQFIKARGGSTG